MAVQIVIALKIEFFHTTLRERTLRSKAGLDAKALARGAGAAEEPSPVNTRRPTV
jgi:hypothetical protein